MRRQYWTSAPPTRPLFTPRGDCAASKTRSIGGEQILVLESRRGRGALAECRSHRRETAKSRPRWSTCCAGILTRQRGDAPQAFGLTVAASKTLDATNQAFGRVVRDQ